MGLLNQVGRLWKKPEAEQKSKNGKIIIKWFDTDIVEDELSAILTIPQIQVLKNWWFDEKEIFENINDCKMLLNLIKWKIISKQEIESLVVVSERNINRIKNYLKQIIELNRVEIKEQRKIIKKFLGIKE